MTYISFPTRHIREMLPVSMVEAGFLFAILFGILGPIPRYLGFLVSIIGMICRRKEVACFLKNLPLSIKISFTTLLFWGAISTLTAESFYSWVKGWTLVLEFVFTVLLASFALRSQEAFSRWKKYSYFLVFYMGSFTLWAFLVNGKTEGLFSLHTFPSTITIPLFPLVLSSLFYKKIKFPTLMFVWIVFFLLISMILIGLSSGALLSNAFAFLVFFVINRPPKKHLALFFICGILVLACIAATLPFSRYWPAVETKIHSEISQLSSFSDLTKLTSNRSDIWGGAFFLIKKHPEGIGWNQFEATVKKYIAENQLEKKHLFPQIHNDYLNVLVEGGIVSFVAYLIFLWKCIYIIISLLKDKDRLTAAFLGSAFTGVSVFALAGGLFDERKILALYFWTVFGAILSRGSGINSFFKENA